MGVSQGRGSGDGDFWAARGSGGWPASCMAACIAARRGGDGCGAGEGVQGGSCVASSNTSPLPMLGSGNLGGGCDVRGILRVATHESVPAPLPPAGTCPSLQGGGEPVWALFVPPPRFRCRVHAVEISASGHGWLSLAVKIKRRCRRSTSGGVQGDAGLPPAMGLRNRSVVLAGDIVGGRVGHVVGGVQERV